MLATYCQGFGEVAQALVLEARVYAVAGHSMKLINHTVSAFPCIEYYSMEALAEHALALRHQHLWCLTTVVLHVVSVQLSTSMQMYN